MLSSFMVVVLIYQSIVHVHVKFIPFVCPAKCRCKANKITSCSIDSIKEFSTVGRTAEIEELRVATCDEGDFDRLSTETLYPVMQLLCENLVFKNRDNQHYDCIYSPKNIPNGKCVNICRKSSSSNAVKCLCFICSGSRPNKKIDEHFNRVRRSAHSDNNTNSTYSDNNTNSTNNKNKDGSTNYVTLLTVAAISIAAFLINFVVMVKLCCSPLTVIDLFGTALMLFNVVLSIYGMSMAFFIFKPNLANMDQFCQFFTSIKLFSLGAGVYTLTLLVFHDPIRRSVDDNLERAGAGEREDKESELKKRDAIFKGIVFILEGVMISGVLCVLSWIKFKDWGHLCAIISPRGSVEELLFGIEMWYYVLSGLLICWYFGNYLYRKYILYTAYRENLKRKKNGDEEEEVKDVTPYIRRDFPIFIMVVVSFILWVGGYLIIRPKSKLFSTDMAAVVRVISVLLPLLMQPFIYIIRNTCCCKCCRSQKDKSSTSDDIRLNCTCTGECNCNNCDVDELSQSRNNNVQVTKFGSARWPSKGDMDKEEHPLSDEDDFNFDSNESTALQKTTKKRKNTYEISKVVCRSPDPSGTFREKPDESTRLLDDMDGKKPSTPNTPTIVIEDEMLPGIADNKDLTVIDETEEGRVSRGPTFYPIAKRETETLPSRIDLKNDSSSDGNTNNETKNNENIALYINPDKGNQKGKKLDKQKTNSTTSLEYSLPDSSVSQESTPHAEEQLSDSNSPTDSTEIDKEHKDIIECDLKKNIHINIELNVHLNNDYKKDASDEKEALLNSSTCSSSPTSDEVSTDTNLNNTLDSNHQDTLNKVQSLPSDGEMNSNHTNNRIRRSLVSSNDGETIER